ncbi:MAG: flagellar export chaperone FlgN [Verrucomicrobiota bacterium]|nr:flagellar export chaperone FlgN [Verrucomicrobiota bacterium]
MTTIPQPNLDQLADELRAHHDLCSSILDTVKQEHQQLKNGDVKDLKNFLKHRNGMLEKVSAAQQKMFAQKSAWLRLTPEERAGQPEIAGLIQKNLDLIMKVVLLDRENEKLLLQNKLVPTSHLPPAGRQNPSLVAQRYKSNH